MNHAGKESYYATTFLHSAGESLQSQIKQRLFAIGFLFAVFAVSLILFYQAAFLDKNSIAMWAWGILGTAAFGGVFFLGKSADKYWQGWHGEMCARYELEPLLREGYEILNDVTGENFNIDFLVIGPGGIYVVEVKNPSKRSKDDKISFQDNKIFLNSKRFEKGDPVAQVKKTAYWVSSLLRETHNAKISHIKPVILFPSFWVEEVLREDVWVLNPKRFVEEHIKHAPKVFTPQEVNSLASLFKVHMRTLDKAYQQLNK